MLTMRAQRRILSLLRADHNLRVGVVDVIHTNAGLALVSPTAVVWAQSPLEVIAALNTLDTQNNRVDGVTDYGRAPRRGE